MKVVRLFSVCAALAALLVMSAPVFAGSTRASVPFQFEVNGKSLPAGEYRFVCPAGSSVMQIIDAKGTTTVALIKEAGQSIAQPELRFEKTGSVNKLSTVVVNGRTGYRTVSIR
jgi:hypothetical protein